MEDRTEPPDPAPISAIELNSTTAGRLRKALARRRVCRRGRWLLKMLGIVLAFVSCMSFAVGSVGDTAAGVADFRTAIVLGTVTLVAIGACIYIGLGISADKAAEFLSRCTAGLSSLCQPSDLRTLLMFRCVDGEEEQDAVANQLIAVIDRVGLEEASCLSNDEWRRLLANVDRDWIADRSDLAIAIIQMFQRSGNPCAIEIVRRCARPGAVLPAQAGVHAAALECLPILESAERELKQRNTLLRGSGHAAASSSELLRAATATDPINSTLLLRHSDAQSHQPGSL